MQITVLGVDEPKIKIPNLKKYIVKNAYDDLHAEMDYSAVSDNPWPTTLMATYTEWNRISADIVLKSSALRDLLEDHRSGKPFDLIIFDDGCCEPVLGLVHKLGNPPLLLATTYGSPQWMTHRAGNVFNPAYVPSMVSPYDQQMTFYERCQNTLYYLMTHWYYYVMLEGLNSDLAKDVFGENAPSGREIAKRANVAIVNHHAALHDPRPMLPGLIGIAGLHIPEQPRQLPQVCVFEYFSVLFLSIIRL